MLKRLAAMMALVAFLGIPGLTGAQATPEADEDVDFFAQLDGYEGGATSTFISTSGDLTGLILVGSIAAQYADDDAAGGAMEKIESDFLEFLAGTDDTVDITGLKPSDDAPNVGDEALAFSGPILFGVDEEQSFTFETSFIFARVGEVIVGVQVASGDTDAATVSEDFINEILDNDPEPAETPVDGDDVTSGIWSWMLTSEQVGEDFVQDELSWSDASGEEFDVLEEEAA